MEYSSHLRSSSLLSLAHNPSNEYVAASARDNYENREHKKRP